MANNTGTLVTSPIRVAASEDTFASAYANEIKGGHHQYFTITERDNIPSERRQEGMLCTIGNKTYRLEGGIANKDWVEIKDGSVGTKTVDETTIGNGKVLVYNLSKDKLEYVEVDVTGGGSTEGSLVKGSKINGNIIVDGVEIIVYNDSGISTGLSNKSDINHKHPISDITNLQTELNKIGIVGTKNVDEATLGDKKILSYNLTKGKLEYIDNFNNSETKQVTKLGIISPHITKIAVEESLDFKFRALEVLKLVGDPAMVGNNIVKTINAFDNGESSDFNINDNVIFDGKMKLKKSFPLAVSVLAGDIYITPLVNKTTYKNFEGINTQTGNKYVIRDINGNYKSYQLVKSALLYVFSVNEMNKFENPEEFVFASNNLRLKNPLELRTMDKDFGYADEGTLFRTPLTKNIQTIELMN